MSAAASPDLEVFLAEAPWLRRLAASLASPADADDLVQAAYERLVTHPPAHLQSPRGWLRQVLRNAHRMRVRASARREARESEGPVPEPLPSAATLAARAQVLGVLAKAVADLAEPFRRTVLLHYYEGVSLADIARDEDCPAATVRGRLRTGLQRLRAELDLAHGGERAAWAVAISPLGVASTPMIGSTALGIGLSVALIAGVGVMALRSTETSESTAQPDKTVVGATPTPANRTHLTDSPAGATEPAVAGGPSPLPTAVSAPPTQAEPEGKRRTAVAHARQLQAIKAARLARLRAEGLDPNTVDEASNDEQFLSDLEFMVMMESGAELAESCVEEGAPKPRTTQIVDIDFIGEPDVGTVVESVSVRRAGGEEHGAWTRCLLESLHLVSLAPPQVPGTLSTTLQFAVDDSGKIMTSMVQAPKSRE